jgi:hypothetical protein
VGLRIVDGKSAVIRYQLAFLPAEISKVLKTQTPRSHRQWSECPIPVRSDRGDTSWVRAGDLIDRLGTDHKYIQDALHWMVKVGMLLRTLVRTAKADALKIPVDGFRLPSRHYTVGSTSDAILLC